MTRLATTVCAVLAVLAAAGCSREEETVTVAPGPEVRTPLQATLVRTIDTGVEDLQGLAVDSAGRLYLAGRTGVRVVDADGAEVRRIDTAAPAQAVAVDEEGNVYIALTTRVEVHAPDGELLTSWGEEGDGPGQFSVITDIAVSGPNVYVADAGNRCVHRFDTTGDYINDIGRRDPAEGFLGLICPSPHLDCVVAADGTLRVNNPGRLRVETYKADGEFVGSWGEAGMAADRFCGCCNPTDIALMPDGRIVTTEKGIPRVKVYDAAGEMLAYVPPETFAADASGMDVATGPEGRIYVAEPASGKVRIFTLENARTPP